MAYIQITTRCNMTCSHCGFNCTHKGEDMSLEVFKKALEFDEYHTIGGGEPTIHPQFWEFLIEAIAYPHSEGVWLATNGAETETAIKLAQLAKKGIIGCDLSLDEYHDAIDTAVIDAFSLVGNTYQKENDRRAIRNVSGKLIKSGRADEGEERCFCDDWIIKPNGDVKACACEDAPTIGNIMDDEFIDPDDRYPAGQCWKDAE